jgi:spore germination cell wall hydrolase CwlJ-like protein
MRFSVPTTTVAALLLGPALTAASVSNAAAPLPGYNQAIEDQSPDGSLQQPRLDDSIDNSDSTVTLGTVPADQAATPAPTLAALVEQNDDNVVGLDTQTQCLAAAIFYEARSESLAGKLAVARVIINRSESGRFPTSLCGVVTQPSQFSFVHGGRIPAVPAAARSWPDSVAIARIALKDGWESKAEGALYFHARQVAPGWGRQKLAQIDNHIFYR